MRNNALISRARATPGTVAFAFALLMLLLRLLVPNVFMAAMQPALRLSETLTAYNHAFLSSFGNASALSGANEELANQNAALANENQTLAQKVADLEALGLRTPSATQGVVAGVILRPPESPYDTLLVNAGNDSAVSVGMEAFGAGGVPLGVVTAVLKKFSRITLYSAPGISTTGWVGKTKLPLALRGEGGGSMMATVSRLAPIILGDAVYLPGPGALSAGSVVRIDSDPSSPSETLRIQSALNLFSITWVELRDVGTSALNAMSLASSTAL